MEYSWGCILELSTCLSKNNNIKNSLLLEENHITRIVTDIPFEQFKMESTTTRKPLGQGGFGVVFASKWESGGKKCHKTVALKKTVNWQKEAFLHAQLIHPNIIEFIGISKSNLTGDFHIVMELAKGGSLLSQLHSDKVELPVGKPLNWTKEIAQAIAYLHCDQPILHGDIKSANVVLTAMGSCKLCDFGSAMALTENAKSVKRRFFGTIPWMSPEMIAQNNKISLATDIWSYGVLVWEIFSRQIPYQHLSAYQTMCLITEHGSTLEVAVNEWPAQITQLLALCWKINPAERPTATELLQILCD